MQARVRAEAFLKALYEQRVDFNGDHAFRPLQQVGRERALAGTDFNYQRFRLRTDRRCNATQDGTANEEMLAELASRGR
jgi:hypothetical protein